MELKQIFTIQKLYIAFEIFSFSMVLVYFTRHFSYFQILLGFMLLFFVPLPIIFFAKKLATKQFIFSSFIIRWLCVFVYVLKPSLSFLYSYFFLQGLIIFFFWVPYNIRYFTFSHRMNRATSAGHFVIVGPILNMFIPFISGVIISQLGPWYIIGTSTLLLLILLFKTSKLPNLDLNYSFFDTMQKSKGLKMLKFIQGSWEAASMAVPLYALMFLSGEVAFGSYLSYIGFVGVAATLVITRFSDTNQKRLKYFFPFVISLALVTISFFFINSISSFAISAGLLGVASTLTYPFFFAVLLDKIEDKSAGMIMREFMLNSGRVFGVAVFLAALFYTGSMKFGFLFLGGMLLVYPALLLARKLYVEEAYQPLLPVAKVYAQGRLAAKVYAHGGFEVMRDVSLKSRDVFVKTFDGTRWATKSVGNKSNTALRKMFSGDQWILRKLKKIEKSDEQTLK